MMVDDISVHLKNHKSKINISKYVAEANAALMFELLGLPELGSMKLLFFDSEGKENLILMGEMIYATID